jgi:hypothetical protein
MRSLYLLHLLSPAAALDRALKQRREVLAVHGCRCDHAKLRADPETS